MSARRMQVYWFPAFSTLAVVVAAMSLDLPERGALARTTHGFPLMAFDTSRFVAWSVAILVLLWAVQALTDRPRRPSPWSHHVYYLAFGVLFADALFLAGGHGRTAEEAGPIYWLVTGLIPAVWLGRHLVARLEDARVAEEGEWDTGPVRRPSLRLARSEKAIWVGRREAPGYRWQLWLSPPLHVLVFAVMFRTRGGFGIDDAPIAIFLIASFLYHVLIASAAEVTVSESAVRVATGPLRIPLWTIPLEELTEAHVEDVRPRAYGGYGYHAKGGRRGLVIRSGPGLLLRRRRGRDILVTVEGAEEGAGLLNALIERRVPSQPDATARA